jgi:hypothetical protein
MRDVPFDRVVVIEAGTPHELSLQQFLALPLHTRIRHILERDVRFFAGEQPVDRQEALRRLKSWSGAAAAPPR